VPKYVDAIEQNALSRRVSRLSGRQRQGAQSAVGQWFIDWLRLGASSTGGGGGWWRFRGL